MGSHKIGSELISVREVYEEVLLALTPVEGEGRGGEGINQVLQEGSWARMQSREGLASPMKSSETEMALRVA